MTSKKSKKKKKEGKHSPPQKGVQKEPTYYFFNKSKKTFLRRRITAELNYFADLYDVDKIDLKTDPDYSKDFRDRDWAWRPRFFMNLLLHAEECKGLKPFERIWLDMLFNQCGIMVWNLVNKTYFHEYKTTGVIPENPLSKRKGGNSIEAVAEHFANTAEQQFREKFE